MKKYLSKRILSSLLAVIGLFIMVFFLARLTGDPGHLYLPIDAPLEVGRERATVYSSGTTHTLSFGFNYDVSENWSLNAASSYTPLDVQRPNESSDNDDFWNVRLGLTMRY